MFRHFLHEWIIIGNIQAIYWWKIFNPFTKSACLPKDAFHFEPFCYEGSCSCSEDDLSFIVKYIHFLKSNQFLLPK